MTKEQLINYLNNQCKPEELEDIIQWIENEAFTEESVSLARRDWTNLNEKENFSLQDDRFNSLLDKIHHRINISEANNPEVRQVNATKIIRLLTKVAAILLLPVVTFLLYLFYNPTFILSQNSNKVVDSLEVIASAGARTIVQLSDGTIVHLNYGSRIKYPRNFVGETREITLSGEGFFDVFHDPGHPFIVKTKLLDIKALGTKFNVLTYSENDKVETTLIEGKVVLESSDINGTKKTVGSLVPGDHANYLATGEISTTSGSIEKYVAWKDGLMIFDNAGITEVAERLGRMYNVDIKVSEEILDYTYTVKFVDESLSQILDLLTKATPVEYKMVPRMKLSDGTYSKQEILFEKRNN